MVVNLENEIIKLTEYKLGVSREMDKYIEPIIEQRKSQFPIKAVKDEYRMVFWISPTYQRNFCEQ